MYLLEIWVLANARLDICTGSTSALRIVLAKVHLLGRVCFSVVAPFVSKLPALAWCTWQRLSWRKSLVAHLMECDAQFRGLETSRNTHVDSFSIWWLRS